MISPLVFWHGSQSSSWSPREDIRPAKKGRTEAGPGIYLTTSYERARSYAKGGGTVFLVEVDPRIRWIDSVRLDLSEASRLVESLKITKAEKSRVIARLEALSERMKTPNEVPASSLVNLLVNGDSLVGANGPTVARFLSSHGVDASADTSPSRSDEHWIVIHNPKMILSATPTKSKDVSLDRYDLPFKKPSGVIVAASGLPIIILAGLAGASFVHSRMIGK